MLAPSTLSEIERRALEIQREIEEKTGPYAAEIVPGVTPQWHMVNTFPGKELKASGYLADRGIGVFVPRFDKGSILEVKQLDGYGRLRVAEKVPVGGHLIFPGRVFIFVWDVLAHWRRIKACEGVQSVFLDRHEHPLVIPDGEINKIQVLQFSLLPKDKKKRKRYQAASEGHLRSESTRCFWLVDSAERNRVLDASLGLAS